MCAHYVRIGPDNRLRNSTAPDDGNPPSSGAVAPEAPAKPSASVKPEAQPWRTALKEASFHRWRTTSRPP
ncbi:hypothetical protein TSH100_15010 [Azospirillum sp. TSH100]|nr:hypothetical protein TSH100_15010 [Azospirillum sp. TSH100]